MKLLFCIFLIPLCVFSQVKTVSKITFLNVKKMDQKFLSNLILSKVGATLDSTVIAKDIIFLNRLNGVSKAEFKVSKIEDQGYQIDYLIVENKSLIPAFDAGTNSKNGFYRVGLYEFNFLGKNNSVGGFYQYNGFNSFGINASLPYLFSNKIGLETNYQKLTSREPIFFDNQKADYQYTNAAFELLGVYQFDYRNQFKIGGSIFNENYQYIEGATNASVPTSLKVDKSLFKFQYTYDKLNYDYYLISGFKSNFWFQYVMTKNTFQDSFLIGWNDFTYFKRYGNSDNFASRLRLGLASNNDSPFSPFAVDNNLNIRGVGNIIDRGTGTLVLNSEYRKTLYEKGWFVLQGNAFVDAGSWRNPGGKLSDFGDSKNFRIYPGIGLRFIHKTIFNCIFRIDYGYGITKNASNGFVFGLGQYF
jgi:hypothetical protein